MASRDDDISNRVSEMASVWRDTMSTLSARYEDTLKENQDLKNALRAADSGERRRAAEVKESRLRALDRALLLNSNQIAETHKELYETSATAAYYLKEYEKMTEGRSQSFVKWPQSTGRRLPLFANG